jgi:pilus assembly protein CpaB
VLQNIQVLAAGQSVQSEAGNPQSAAVLTLLVTPREAEILTLAASEGRIQLALRNRMDSEVMMTPGAWIRSLAGAGAPPPEARPAVRARAPAINAMRSVVEIFNGSARTVVTF